MNSKFNKLYNQIISEMIIVEDFKTAAIVWQDIPESKFYIDKFKNELRQKVKSPLNDIEYWIKQGYAAFKEFVDGYKSKTEQDKDNIVIIAEKNGAEYLTEINGYELWFVPSYEAAKQLGRFYKGKSASWCISTDNELYWERYSADNIFVFCIQKDFNPNDRFSKVALQIDKDSPNIIHDWDINDIVSEFKEIVKSVEIFTYVKNNFNILFKKQKIYNKYITIDKIKLMQKTKYDEFVINSNDDLLTLTNYFDGELPKLYFNNLDNSSFPEIGFTIPAVSIESIRLNPKITNLQFMFYNWSKLKSIPLFDTSNIISMDSMFYNCESLESIPLFNTSNVTKMYMMFAGCINLKNIPLFNTSNVTNMYHTFYNCKSLKLVPLFNTSSVTDMHGMFYGCKNLESVPLFNTSNVTNMSFMFANCEKLEKVPLFNISKVKRIDNIFKACTTLKNNGYPINDPIKCFEIVRNNQ